MYFNIRQCCSNKGFVFIIYCHVQRFIICITFLWWHKYIRLTVLLHSNVLSSGNLASAVTPVVYTDWNFLVELLKLTLGLTQSQKLVHEVRIIQDHRKKQQLIFLTNIGHLTHTHTGGWKSSMDNITWLCFHVKKLDLGPLP